jgi:hypothetical protein
MENFMLIIIVVAVLFYSLLFFKGVHYTVDDREFKQAGVRINFANNTITVKGKTYRVGQVTGIRMEAFTRSHRHGNSIAKTVTIDLDDFSKPHHKVLFISKGHSRKFMQRLSIALRKAGGPDFVL